MKRILFPVAPCLVLLPLVGYVVHANLSAGEQPSIYADAGAAPELVSADTVAGADELEKLAKTDAVAFLEKCLDRYRKEVKGYRAIFHKQERIGGRMNKPEEIEVAFLESPHSVFMNWRNGARLAERTLYVEGENGNKLLVRPNGAIRRVAVGDVAERDVAGDDAKQSGRYTLDQFGLKKSMERVQVSWKAAKDKGTLKVQYKGIAKVPMAGNRTCYHLHRVCASPENDGVMEHTVYVDTETLLFVGSRATSKNGDLIGEYYYRDIKLNPEFDADQFTRAALTPK